MQLGGRRGTVVEKGGGEHDGLAAALGPAGDDPHRKPAPAARRSRPLPRITLRHEPSSSASATGNFMFPLNRHSRSAPAAAARDHSGKPV